MATPDTRRELRWYRRDSDLCTTCGAPTVAGFRSCPKHLSAMRDRIRPERKGQIRPYPTRARAGMTKSIMMRFKITPAMRGKISEVAAINAMSDSTLVREAVERYLEDYDEMQAKDTDDASTA